MRRFAAKLTLQCHCSSAYAYIGLDFLLRMPQKPSSYSSRTSTSLKVRPFAPETLLRRPWRDGVPLFELSPVLSYGLAPVVRTSNPRIPLNLKGLPAKKACVWPAVPLAIPRCAPYLTLSPRRFSLPATSMTARPNHRSAASGQSGARTSVVPPIVILIRRVGWLCVSRCSQLFHSGRFSVARFHNARKMASAHPVQATSSIQPLPSLVSDSKTCCDQR